MQEDVARELVSELVRDLDAAHAKVGKAQRQLLAAVARGDDLAVWEDDGAYDMAHWLTMRYGLSSWKARRWIEASHGLEGLPQVGDALPPACSGSTRWSSSAGLPRPRPRRG